MTRIGHQNLTSARRTGVIAYDRTLEFLVLYNNNPVPLYVRLGSPEIPNELNYDIAVPPNYIMAISVNSNQFGFRLGDSNVVITQITGNTVIEATIDEAPPSLGGVPINNASLSTADLLNGVPAFAGVTVFGPFNVNQWGGLIVNVIPTATSGQGVIQVDVSADGATFIPYQTWAFWANIPATILVPRVSQFCRITLNVTAIAGEPGIAGNVSIRGSLAEIAIPSYTPQGASITKTYALAASGSQQYQFVTTGYPAVSIAAIATAGTGASAAITLLVEASSDLVNWRQVTFRTQRMTTGITLYRALGNLDLFMRVTVFEVGGLSAANGTVYLSIPSEADTGAILNTIQQSLGDNGAPSNTNQDIYHELDNVRTGIGTTNSNLGTVHNDLVGIDAKSQTQINFLSTINTTTQTMSGTETNMNNFLGTINTTTQSSDNKLSIINTSLGTINTSIGSTNTAIAAETAQVTAIANAMTRGAGLAGFGAFVPGAVGSFVNTGAVLVPGAYITAAQVSIACAAATTNTLIELAWGTSTGPVFIFYRCYANVGAVSGGVFMGSGPTVQYWSTRVAGLLIPALQDTLWALTNAPVGAAMSGHVVSAL